MRLLLGRQLLRPQQVDAGLRQPGRDLGRARRGTARSPSRARAALMAASCSAGVRPSGRRLGDVPRQLLLEAGDADHEELVEVRGDDGQELEPLERAARSCRAPRRARAR